MLRSKLILCGPLLLAGCVEHDYVYRPVSNTGAVMSGHIAADYPIPTERPTGDVRIATYGFADLVPQGNGPGDEVRAIHLREVVANNGTRPWVVDTRAQRLLLPGAGESRPAYASADAGSPPPIVEVPVGGKRTIDLFFPLPTSLARADTLPAFDTVWTVQTDARVITERTAFERIELVPYYNHDPYVYGPYWYDPYYPGHAFVGVTVPVYVHRPIVVRGVHGPGHVGGHRR